MADVTADVRVLLATGGTGGHIYPALAVAEELTARGTQPVFLGQARGMEARLVGETPYPFYGVRAGKWDRSRPDPRQAWQAVMGVQDALRVLKRVRPQAAVGFGGFASFPGLAGALRLGIPFILHEQNAFPGRVTRWLQAHARLVATAQSEVHPRLARAKRLEHVGMPVRETRLPKAEARARLGLREGRVALVMGGSQGSATLNRAVPAAYRALSPELREGLTVLHGSGPPWEDEVAASVADLPGYRVAGWLDAVTAWSAADLAITRAGTGTIAEAAFHGVPLLMVPLPSAAEDHQRHNARAVAAAGAGRFVEEGELAALATSLATQWQELMDDRVLAAASRAARGRSPEGAAARLAELALEVALSHARAEPRGPAEPQSSPEVDTTP